MLNFRGNETILPCDFEDSKGFQKAPHLLVGKYPSSLGSQIAPPSLIARSPSIPRTFLPRFHQRIPRKRWSCQPIQRTAFRRALTITGAGVSQPCYELLIRLLRRLAVNRIAVNAWCFTLAMAQNSKTKKTSPKALIYTKFNWKWMNLDRFEPYPSWCERI